MKYLIMYRDECGDVNRAYGHEFLEKDHVFPDFDTDDDAMSAALLSWITSIEHKAQQIWNSIHGEECTIFLENDYSDMFHRMSISELETYADCYF